LAKYRSKLTELALDFIQNHLKSPNDVFRFRGMVVGEVLTNFFGTDAHKLKFEYEESDESRLLKKLAGKMEENLDEQDFLSPDLEAMVLNAFSEPESLDLKGILIEANQVCTIIHSV